MEQVEDIHNIHNIYKKKEKEFNEKLDISKNYKYIFAEDNIVKLYLGTQLVLTASYCLLGRYNLYNSIWYWGYGLFLVNKSLSVEKKTLKQFNKNLLKKILKKTDKYYPDHEFYNYITFNDNFLIKISDMAKIIEFGIYVYDSEWYLPIYNDQNGMTCLQNNNNHCDKDITSLNYIDILLLYDSKLNL